MSDFISNVGKMFASTLSNPAQWLIQALGGGSESAAGITINMRTVLGIPEVWYAVSKITGHLSQMEIECKKRRIGKTPGWDTVYSDSGARALQDPNEIMTSQVLLEKIILDALLYGNGRAYIERNAVGQPVGLVPMQAEDTLTVMVNGERWHTVTIDPGTEIGRLRSVDENGEKVTSCTHKIPDRDCLYLMGLTSNGFWGLNTIELLKDVLGLSLAGQEATGTSFRNAGRPGLLLEAPRGAFRTEKEAKAFLDSFNDAHQGLDNAGKTGLLRDGMTAHVLPPNPTTGYVEQRQFQRESAAMIFLLDQVIGDNTGAVYKSITERNSAYLTNALGRWICKIEQECAKKLLSDRQKQTGLFRYKMDVSPLFKWDRVTLAAYTSSLRQQSVISGDEVREMHGLNPAGLTDDYVMGSDNRASDENDSDQEDESDDDGDDQDES